MLRRQLGDAQGRVARLLAEREASTSGEGVMRTSSGDTPGFVDRVASLQTRVLELEAQLERGGSSVSQLGTSVSGRPTLTSHVIPLHTLTEDSETGLVHACSNSRHAMMPVVSLQPCVLLMS
jgi:hypothetical protein